MNIRYLAIAIVFLIVLSSAALILAKPPYREKFFETYPGTRDSRIGKDCSICHFNPNGGGPRNPYGIMVENRPGDVGDFETFGNEDADGDGYSDIQEIKAFTYPGFFSDHPVPEKNKRCVTFIGSKNWRDEDIMYCIVNGEFFDMSQLGGACYIKKDKMMAPLRVGIEQMGGSVSYDAKDKRIDIQKDGKLVGQMWVGKSTAKIGGKNYPLEVPPEITNGRTFVPVKAVGDALLAKLIWINRGKIAHFVY